MLRNAKVSFSIPPTKPNTKNLSKPVISPVDKEPHKTSLQNLSKPNLQNLAKLNAENDFIHIIREAKR
jgi:hypothetical protein